MFKSLFLYFAAPLLIFISSVNALELDNNVKTFKDFNAAVALPADNWRWAEQPLSGTLCAATDGKGNVFSFFAAQDKNFQMDNVFVETFERGFFSEGDYNKIRGGIITFENIPCYELLAELNKKKLVAVRIFSADGIFYRMNAACDINSKSNMEEVFSSFKFEKPPILQPPTEAEKKQEPVAGFIIGLIIIAVLLLYMFKVTFSKKREQ